MMRTLDVVRCQSCDQNRRWIPLRYVGRNPANTIVFNELDKMNYEKLYIAFLLVIAIITINLTRCDI